MTNTFTTDSPDKDSRFDTALQIEKFVHPGVAFGKSNVAL